jgi:hypothetical protein
MANHASLRTTQLYDRRAEEVTLERLREFSYERFRHPRSCPTSAPQISSALLTCRWLRSRSPCSLAISLFWDSESSSQGRLRSASISGVTPIVTGPVISRPAATPPGADTVWSAPPRPANKTKAKIEPHSAAREGSIATCCSSEENLFLGWLGRRTDRDRPRNIAAHGDTARCRNRLPLETLPLRWKHDVKQALPDRLQAGAYPPDFVPP